MSRQQDPAGGETAGSQRARGEHAAGGEFRRPEKIVSGGQTGVDRAALDVAMSLGVAHGGWCPRGRRAEDGEIPLRYRLKQTASRQYPLRTQWNIRDSDATLIVSRGALSGGTLLTLRLAQQQAKPYLVVDVQQPSDPQAIRRWLASHHVRVLNVAGPRESQCPGIGQQAGALLQELFG